MVRDARRGRCGGGDDPRCRVQEQQSPQEYDSQPFLPDVPHTQADRAAKKALSPICFFQSALWQKGMLDKSLILLRCNAHIFAEHLDKISLLAEAHHVADVSNRKSLVEQEQLALLNPDPIQIVRKRTSALCLKSSAEIAGGASYLAGHLLQLEWF